MRPDLVEGAAEVVEVTLLGTEVGLRRPSGFALEGSVHAFVTAILLRLTRLDGLRTDAEPYPPSAEACEPSEADGSEGRAVVGADDGGNAELTEDLDEYGLGELDRRGVQPSALEQESAETVLDGKGIAVAAVEHLRTTNVVESPFAALRLRTTAAKRFKRVESATALIWKLLLVAEKRFRRLDAPHLLKDVYEGRKFEDGKPVSTQQRKNAA